MDKSLICISLCNFIATRNGSLSVLRSLWPMSQRCNLYCISITLHVVRYGLGVSTLLQSIPSTTSILPEFRRRSQQFSRRFRRSDQSRGEVVGLYETLYLLFTSSRASWFVHFTQTPAVSQATFFFSLCSSTWAISNRRTHLQTL